MKAAPAEPTPLPPAFVDALAAILADALVADVKAYPSDIPMLTGDMVTSRSGSDRSPSRTAGTRRPRP